MNTKIVVLSCLGTLMVILNKPVGEWLYQTNDERGERDGGVWFYRGMLILVGLCLTALSFSVYD